MVWVLNQADGDESDGTESLTGRMGNRNNSHHCINRKYCGKDMNCT